MVPLVSDTILVSVRLVGRVSTVLPLFVVHLAVQTKFVSHQILALASLATLDLVALKLFACSHVETMPLALPLILALVQLAGLTQTAQSLSALELAPTAVIAQHPIVALVRKNGPVWIVVYLSVGSLVITAPCA